MMIEHFGIKVKSLENSKVFYTNVLATLDCTQKVDYGVTVGYGKKDEQGVPNFWLVEEAKDKEPTNIHFAFGASSKEQVAAFHKVALENGGKCNGAPGFRTHYGPTYYAAFVIDLDGNNIEALHHATA